MKGANLGYSLTYLCCVQVYDRARYCAVDVMY